MMVTGPSLTSSSSIFAPKTPRPTGTPRASSSSQNRSYTGSASSGGAASAKLGRLPFAVSARSVNWETTSASPPVSSTLRSNRPAASGKTRSRVTFPARRAASSPASPRPTPRRTHRPGPISATISPATRTLAWPTRWQTALMGRWLLRCQTPLCVADTRASVQLFDPGAVLLGVRLQRARELEVPVRLVHAPLLLEDAAERIVGIVVDGRELEQLAELGLGGIPAPDAEVRDAERLPDRGLIRFPLLRLLECHRRLGRHAALQMGLALLEEAVRRLAHDSRYGKFSFTKSTGYVKSRVLPISNPAIRSPAAIARSKATPSSKGGPVRASRNGRSSGPSAQSGALPSGLAGSSSIGFTTRPSTTSSAARCGASAGGSRRPLIAPAAPERVNASAKAFTSPGVNTVSAAMTRHGSSIPAASPRCTASPQPRTPGCPTVRSSRPNP